MLRDARAMRRLQGNHPRDGRGRMKIGDVLTREGMQAIRSLSRSPGLVLAATLTLALGIGANTAVFSVVNGVLLRPLPFRDPDALVSVRPERAVSLREISFLRENAPTLQSVAAVSPGWLMALTGVPEPIQLNAARVTGNFFEILAVAPILGRTFGVESDVLGSEPVAVLSHALWMSQFGGAADVLGQTLVLDRVAHTVIGVMPPGYEVMFVRPDLWIPLPLDPESWTWASPSSLAIGRMNKDATIAAATTELRALDVRIREVFAMQDGDPDPRVASLAGRTVEQVRTPMLVLLAAAGFILLIACANVANLLLVRAVERRHELAVRLALGAARADVVRVVLLESIVLAITGGAAGLVLAWAGAGVLRGLLPADTPRIDLIGVDGGALGACIVATLMAGILFGAMPAFHGARNATAEWLRRGRTVAGGARSARGALVMLEIALAVVLAAGAGLMARTLAAFNDVDAGFNVDHILTLRLQPSGMEPDVLRAYWRRVLEEVRALPGVEGAATVLHLPLAGRTWSAVVEVEGQPAVMGDAQPRVPWQSISTGYLETAGIPLLQGRDFATSDASDGTRVALVNDAFVRDYFPGGGALGHRIRTRFGPTQEWATIVGVVGAVLHDSLSAAPRPEFYVPFEQVVVVATGMMVRTQGDPLAMAGAVRRSISNVDPDVPISQVQSMREIVTSSLGRPRLLLALLAAFAVLGIVLGAVGIAGVVAWVVRQRRREIGIRAALGASPFELAGMVARDGLGWALLGVAIGVPGALALTQLLRGLVFGVSTTDPLTFVAVPAALLCVAALAGWLPALAAAKVQPASVLSDS
jgi:predicted permease